MKFTKYTTIFFLLIFIFIPLFSTNTRVEASSTSSVGLLSYTSTACLSEGDCTLDDAISVTVYIFNLILGIVGSLSLLMFVYGGFSFLISSGESDKVTKAKSIIKNAIIGLVIVFASYTIVSFTLQAIGYTASWT